MCSEMRAELQALLEWGTDHDSVQMEDRAVSRPEVEAALRHLRIHPRYKRALEHTTIDRMTWQQVEGILDVSESTLCRYLQVAWGALIAELKGEKEKARRH